MNFKTGTLITLGAALLMAAPAHADDVEDSIEAALEAYRSGDIDAAKEEIDFASQLLSQLKAEGLRDFLPAPLAGWERHDDDTSSHPMGAFGGGQMASASYMREGETVDIQLMANNQMVTAMAGMFANAAMMGSMGKVQRIGGEKVVISSDGEVQALVDGRIMVQISGSADAETKTVYFEAIDIKGLKSF